MRKTLLSLLLLFPLAAAAEYSYTPSPIIGHDPTWGWILGGALFVYPQQAQEGSDSHDRYFDIMAMRVDRPAGALLSHYRQRNLLPGVDFRLHFGFSNFFDSWYGEGGDTPVEPLHEIDQENLRLRPELRFPLSSQSAWSLFAEYRQRNEQAVDGDSTLRLFPDERGTAIGFGLHGDSRDDAFNPTRGHLANLTLSWQGPQMSNLEGSDTVVQLEGAWGQYVTLLPHLQWAGRLSAGASTGTPGYLFRYTLGGEKRMRGLEQNRLRGTRYWMLQNELRFPVWRIVSGTLFVDNGAMGDNDFSAPVSTCGAGVHVALPPDFRVHLRFDIARREGERNLLYVSFNHAF